VTVWPDGIDEGRFVARAPWHDHALPDEATGGEFASAEQQFTQLQLLVTRLRGLRQVADLKPRDVLDATLRTDSPEGVAWQECTTLLRDLAGVSLAGHGAGDDGIALPIAGATLTLHGLDPVVIRPRLEADLKSARGEVKRAEGKLGNEKFTGRAPAELVQAERDKVDRYTREAEHLEQVLAQLG
jgi:valyl-tRNA synthetase